MDHQTLEDVKLEMRVLGPAGTRTRREECVCLVLREHEVVGRDRLEGREAIARHRPSATYYHEMRMRMRAPPPQAAARVT